MALRTVLLFGRSYVWAQGKNRSADKNRSTASQRWSLHRDPLEAERLELLDALETNRAAYTAALQGAPGAANQPALADLPAPLREWWRQRAVDRALAIGRGDPAYRPAHAGPLTPPPAASPQAAGSDTPSGSAAPTHPPRPGAGQQTPAPTVGGGQTADRRP